MITIKFNNQDIYLTPIHLDNILESLKLQQVNLSEYLDAYSFESPEAIHKLIQDKDKLIIYYHQDIPEDFDTLNPQHFETILKCLEHLYIYGRDFPLLQMDFYPDEVTIYTYTQIYEKDFEKFTEAPNKEYTWDKYPDGQLHSPFSNMQVQSYNAPTRIAFIYHYYNL